MSPQRAFINIELVKGGYIFTVPTLLKGVDEIGDIPENGDIPRKNVHVLMDIMIHIHNEEGVIFTKELTQEVELIKNKLDSIVEALEQLGWSLKNIDEVTDKFFENEEIDKIQIDQTSDLRRYNL